MALEAAVKTEIVESYRRHGCDTGSAEVQIALLTGRINHLTEHMKSHKKDFGSRHGLLKLVGKRSRLLKYLSRTEPERYQQIISRLGLRK